MKRQEHKTTKQTQRTAHKEKQTKETTKTKTTTKQTGNRHRENNNK